MHRVLFQIGGFSIYSYGVCITLALLICTALIRREAIRSNIRFDEVLDCLFWVIIGGLVGGRLLYVLINLKDYTGDPVRILAFRDGGMAVHGSVFLGAVSGYIAARVRKISFSKTADLIAPYIPLGQAIGRVGCFLNGCCYGKPASCGFYVIFEGDIVPRIPVQAISSVCLCLIFLMLLELKKKNFFDGAIILLYLMSYSLFRFGIEYFRGDNPCIAGGMTLAQVISIVIFAVSFAVFVAVHIKKTRY